MSPRFPRLTSPNPPMTVSKATSKPLPMSLVMSGRMLVNRSLKDSPIGSVNRDMTMWNSCTLFTLPQKTD